MQNQRDKRLLYEFQQIRDLQTPYSLFEIHCARLTPAEQVEFLKRSMSSDVIHAGLRAEFLPPAQFAQRYPGLPPEKYGITYSCKGLDEQRAESTEHAMEVVFSLKYPSEAPIFVWLTSIWHPNIRRPYICVQGRPFAVGLTLAQIIVEVGHMVQYQNYNLADPLNWDAEAWVRSNPRPFPVDTRDLRDRRRQMRTAPPTRLLDAASASDAPLVDLLDSTPTRAAQPLVEFVGDEL
jgi:ubiquitin-protein ligase